MKEMWKKADDLNEKILQDFDFLENQIFSFRDWEKKEEMLLLIEKIRILWD